MLLPVGRAGVAACVVAHDLCVRVVTRFAICRVPRDLQQCKELSFYCMSVPQDPLTSAWIAGLLTAWWVPQVNQATKLKSKAGRLQEMAAELLGKAKTEKETAAALKAKYYTTMDQYGEAVQKIDTATQTAQQILDQMNAQSLTLAEVATEYGAATQHGEDPDAAGAQALKGQLQNAQTDLAAITAQKAQADEDTQEARKLADQYQPMIIDAEKDKRESDMHFQNFADLTHQADELQNRADALLARADTIDGLIQATQAELAQKRKNFEHYKNRAQTEMAISLQAEDKEALLRKQAREARYKAAELSDKARRLRALAQKGVNNVMESTDAPQPEE